MLEIQGIYTVYSAQCTVYIDFYMYMVKGTSAGYSVQRYVGWIIKEGWLTLSPNKKYLKNHEGLIGCSFSNIMDLAHSQKLQ